MVLHRAVWQHDRLGTISMKAALCPACHQVNSPCQLQSGRKILHLARLHRAEMGSMRHSHTRQEGLNRSAYSGGVAFFIS